MRKLSSFIDTALRNVLETLFCSLFVWYGFLAFVPSTVAYSSLYEYLDVYGSSARFGVGALFFILATIGIFSVYYKIYALRILNYFVSGGICTLYAGVLVFSGDRIAGTAGPLLILAILAYISVWQLTQTRRIRREDHA